MTIQVFQRQSFHALPQYRHLPVHSNTLNIFGLALNLLDLMWSGACLLPVAPFRRLSRLVDSRGPCLSADR